MAQINTTITLRQGTTSEWSDSLYKLAKGEMGLEYLADGSVKIKCGDGTKKWSELPYVGSDVKAANVFQVTLAETDVDEIAAIERQVLSENATKQDGDIAIVKAVISKRADNTEVYSYTSFVYEKALDTEASGVYGWTAMDGNYSANNIIFKNDITLAGSYTSVGNITKTASETKTLSAAGKSLADVMQSIFTKEINPGDTGYGIDLPSASISVSSNGSAEVGNTFSLPSATLSITDVGSYPFGTSAQKATGIKFHTVTLTHGSNTVSNESDMVAGNSISITATGNNTKYGDSAVSFTFTGTAQYSAATVTPISNLGNPVESKKIAAGSATVSSKTVSFTGWRKWFYGGDTKTDFASSTIRALTNSTSSASAQSFELKAASYTNCSRIVIAILKSSGINLKEVLLKSSSNADITGEFKKINTDTNKIEVEGFNGYTAKEYNVWEYKPASLDSSEVYTIKIG